jgi:hypothetical protein
MTWAGGQKQALTYMAEGGAAASTHSLRRTNEVN